MKRRCIFRKKDHDRIFGQSMDDLHDILMTLIGIEDSVAMTDEEERAMEAAVDIINAVRNAMAGDGKIDWELYRE